MKSSSYALLLASLAIAMLGGFLVVCLFPVAVWLFAVTGMSGELLTIGFIGLLGAGGGVLSAAREGTLQLPRRDERGDLQLGMIQEIAFGFVGGIVIFLVVPSASSKAPKLGEAAVEQVRMRRLEAAQTVSAAGASERAATGSENDAVAGLGAQPGPVSPQGVDVGGSTSVDKGKTPASPRDLDWIELVSLALIGGYCGRALLARAAAAYVTTEQLTSTVRAETGEVDKRRRVDQEAANLFHDQIDVYTNPPDAAQLAAAIRAASPLTRQMVYVQTRARAHMYMMLAAQMPSEADKSAFLRRVAQRVIPLMTILRSLDTEEAYRGSRFLLAIAFYFLQEPDQAQQYLDEAVRISQARHPGEPLPMPYRLLQSRLQSKAPCDAGFLTDLLHTKEGLAAGTDSVGQAAL